VGVGHKLARVKSAVRFLLLVLALAGLVVFLSFHISSIGPRQTITVGASPYPWLKWTRLHGLGDLGHKVEVKALSWSAVGLVVSIVALVLRKRVK
jgi:hypothetical protein